MNLHKIPKQMMYLWYLGVRESLQLHRCVVLVVLDEENLLWAKVWDLMQLHGAIFLGSMLWWQYAAHPAITWILTRSVQPALGAAWTQAVLSTLAWLHQALWMMPVYMVTLIVSCTWYNELAQRAVHVRRKHSARLAAEQQAAQQQVPAGRPQPQQASLQEQRPSAGSKLPTQRTALGSSSSSSHAGNGSPYESVAEELYRVVLFLVLYLEVILVGFIPGIGRALYLVLSCWLYAYYCYDYQWALQGMRVQDRLALFEGCAPFFAGYGLILAVVTMLPFFLGAALFSLLFPVFILVACESDVANVMYAVIQPSSASAETTSAAASEGQHGRGQALTRTPLPIHGNTMLQQPSRQHFNGSGFTQHGSTYLSGSQATCPAGQLYGTLPGQRAARAVRFRLPVLSLAAWPTQWVLRLIFGSTQARAVKKVH